MEGADCVACLAKSLRWVVAGGTKERKLKTRCVVAEDNTQLKRVSSNSNSVCVCVSEWICGATGWAKNWRLVKNGERTSSDTSSQSSVGWKDFKMWGGGRVCAAMQGRRKNVHRGSTRSAGLDGRSMDSRQRVSQLASYTERKNKTAVKSTFVVFYLYFFFSKAMSDPRRTQRFRGAP